MRYLLLLSACFASIFCTSGADAAIIISEVHSMGSQTSTYGEDWFELTNTGTTAVDITGWRMDDGSFNFLTSVALADVTSIQAGQSVVFIEGDTVAVDAFQIAWFGTNVPAGFTIGTYNGTGAGVGMSSNGDGLIIFDSLGVEITRVSFGTGTLNFTFDNASGLANSTITSLSSVGMNGAFLSQSGEVGSPGSITAIPEPSVCSALAIGGYFLARRRRKFTTR